MAEDGLNSRLMSQVAEEILKPFQEPIHGLYVDTDFLYDYRLGELILKLHDQKQFDYLKSCIPAYEQGNSRQITKYFPELKVTEEELDLLENDVKWQKFVAMAAPRTGFLLRFNSFLAKINTYNHSKELNHPFRLTLNMRKIPMPDKILSQLVQHIKEFDRTIEIRVTHYKNWNEVPEASFNSWTMLLVYDLVDFVRYGTVSQKMLKSEKCLDKIILSPYQTEEDFTDPQKEEQAFMNFKALMSLMVSEFSFVRKNIPIER